MTEQVTDDFCSECDVLRHEIEGLEAAKEELESDVFELEQEVMDLEVLLQQGGEEALAEAADILYGLYEVAEERGASQEDLRVLQARLFLRSQGANL